MSKIIVQKECGCFKRSNYENNKSYKSKDDALLQANIMVDHMNTKFCQKHIFKAVEENNDILISVNMREKASSECCGGGHCS